MGLIGNLKGAGSPGPAGPAGPAGIPGPQWFTGTVAPLDALGINGDFYLNVATGDLFRKAGNTWA